MIKTLISVDNVEYPQKVLITKTLLNITLYAHNLGCNEASEMFREYLLLWTFKGGQITLPGLRAYAVLVVLTEDGENPDTIKGDICKHLQGDRSPEQKVLQGIARRIRTDNILMHEHLLDIDIIMSQLDRRTFSKLMLEIADILSEQNGPMVEEVQPDFILERRSSRR